MSLKRRNFKKCLISVSPRQLYPSTLLHSIFEDLTLSTRQTSGYFDGSGSSVCDAPFHVSNLIRLVRARSALGYFSWNGGGVFLAYSWSVYNYSHGAGAWSNWFLSGSDWGVLVLFGIPAAQPFRSKRNKNAQTKL